MNLSTPVKCLPTLRPRSARFALVGAVLFLVLAASAAPAQAAPAGYDFFTTDPVTTVFKFNDVFTIPADFFDPGSQPFSGEVHFGGEHVGTFQNQDTGDADTIVQRKNPANLVPPFPAADMVPIELVQLNLVSVEPITVQVGSATQTWDVRATLSPTRTSQGQMMITKTGDQGGTFSSQMMVTPLFTFTRSTDGAQRTLDLGSPTIPPTAMNALVLQADNVPWRDGCVPPALPLPGLNDNFCPGLTTDGQKQLTIEAALLAQHGIYPAQPRLEHFQCYDALQVGRRFKRRSVALTDQFGRRKTRVLRPLELCNPAMKQQEPFINKTEHLKCYSITSSKFDSRFVAVRNQFGAGRLKVVRPYRLCLPSTKQVVRRIRHRPPIMSMVPTIDHFQCYTVTGQGRFKSRKVRLTDQFGRVSVRVIVPKQLCNPVKKNDTTILHPVQHLVCYRIKPAGRRFRKRLVQVTNQFGTELLAMTRPRTLCVPSLKLALP